MPMIHPGTNIVVPSPEDETSCAGYTGFNSLDLNRIYRVERLPAFRSQIAVGYGKPIVARLPEGDLLATGFYNHEDEPDYVYPDGRRAHSDQWWTREEAALMRSSDEGKDLVYSASFRHARSALAVQLPERWNADYDARRRYGAFHRRRDHLD